MNYNRKIMRLELSAEKALNGGYYYAGLLLPATDYEVKDAMQRTRAVGRENTVEVSILECDILPELQDIRLDTFSLDELNFFAKRLASLSNEELPVFYAVTEKIFGDAEESENPVSIKELINCTYGLDTVPVAHNVSNLAELGRFTFENELLSDLEGIPEPCIMTDRRYMTARPCRRKNRKTLRFCSRSAHIRKVLFPTKTLRFMICACLPIRTNYSM